nr:hypothetical protein [Candidatus Sigynarchaeota archaeon]
MLYLGTLGGALGGYRSINGTVTSCYGLDCSPEIWTTFFVTLGALLAFIFIMELKRFTISKNQGASRQNSVPYQDQERLIKLAKRMFWILLILLGLFVFIILGPGIIIMFCFDLSMEAIYTIIISIEALSSMLIVLTISHVNIEETKKE